MPKKKLGLTEKEKNELFILEDLENKKTINKKQKDRLEILHQQQLAAEQAKTQRNAEKVAERKKLHDAVTGRYFPSMQEGDMQKMRHLGEMTQEGAAMLLFLDLVIFAFELITNSPYQDARRKYAAAVKQEDETVLPDGKKIRLVYREDENGKLPKIFYADKQTGQLDYSRVIPPSQVTTFDIRANGLVPPPNVMEGFKVAFLRHLERVEPTWLTKEDQMELYGMLDTADQVAPKRDLVADNLIRQRMMMKPGK